MHLKWDHIICSEATFSGGRNEESFGAIFLGMSRRNKIYVEAHFRNTISGTAFNQDFVDVGFCCQFIPQREKIGSFWCSIFCRTIPFTHCHHSNPLPCHCWRCHRNGDIRQPLSKMGHDHRPGHNCAPLPVRPTWVG